MTSLADAFQRAAAADRTKMWTDRYAQVMELGLAPFDTGGIFISIDDRERFDRVLTFRMERLPSYPFRFKFSDEQLVQAYSVEEWLFDQIKDPLFRHFRYRPSLPVDDHIVLGEE
jgi:hypothetical protein